MSKSGPPAEAPTGASSSPTGSLLVSRAITERAVPEAPREEGPGDSNREVGRASAVRFFNGGRAVVFERALGPKREQVECPDTNSNEGQEEEGHQVEVEVRGGVTGFSRRSRLRLRRTLNRLERDVVPLFVTLTYPASECPTPEEFGRHVQRYKVAYRRAFPRTGFVWKVEFTRQGVPHMHLLVFGVTYKRFREWHVPTWVRCIATEHPHAPYVANLGVEPARSAVSVSAYVGKYVWGDKRYQENGGDEWCGRRWWGVVGKPYLPWAEEVPVEVPDEVVVRLIRYARKRGSIYNERWRASLGWRRPWWQSKARKHIPARRYPTLEYECDPTAWATLLGHEMARCATENRAEKDEGTRVRNGTEWHT